MEAYFAWAHEQDPATILSEKTRDGLKYSYLKRLLTEIPKHMDDTSLDFLEDLLPWSEILPEEFRKKI